MASGWWKTTHVNLAAGSPADLTVTTALAAPRGYPKLASIATGAGLFLGGTPCITVDDVIYYAGDSYTQDTNPPILKRWDGRVNATVLEVPPVGVTNAKAILSLTSDDNDNIYFSTWDSGTTASNFAGRVFKFNPSTGVLATFGANLYTAGRLPYALAVFNDKLYIGTTNVDPASGSLIRSVALVGETAGWVEDTSTTTTYKITARQTGSLTESGPSNTVSVTTRATLTSEAFNVLTWSAPTIIAADPTVTPTIVSNTAVAGIFRSTGSPYYFKYSYSSAVAATSTAALTAPSAFSSSMLPVVDNRAIDITVPHSTDPAIQWIHFHYNHTGSGDTAGYAETTGGFVVANNVAGGTATFTITGTGSTNLVSPYPTTNTSTGTVADYRVYRTAGHTTTGRLTTTTSLTFTDDGDAGGAETPPAANAITAPSTLAVAKTNPKLFTGAVGCLIPFNSKLYAGMYYPVASGFATVQEITTANVASTSNTIAPGGTARDYNGFTAGIVFESNLYLGYWNDDTTDIRLIRKFTGSVWSTVDTVSGANARPVVAFHEHNGECFAVGGGDAKDAFLYTTPDGTTWTDETALLPTGEEGIPFIATANVLGGF